MKTKTDSSITKTAAGAEKRAAVFRAVFPDAGVSTVAISSTKGELYQMVKDQLAEKGYELVQSDDPDDGQDE